jgi:hypothetical protein
MNSCESEVSTISVFDIATNLAVNEELLPGLSDGPVKVVDPIAGSIGWHGHICISGILEHSVLVAESLINLN